jgi:hypothetical protein
MRGYRVSGFNTAVRLNRQDGSVLSRTGPETGLSRDLARSMLGMRELHWGV